MSISLTIIISIIISISIIVIRSGIGSRVVGSLSPLAFELLSPMIGLPALAGRGNMMMVVTTMRMMIMTTIRMRIMTTMRMMIMTTMRMMMMTTMRMMMMTTRVAKCQFFYTEQNP